MIHPVSTEVIKIPSAWNISCALVRVTMFIAAFAAFVFGCPAPLYPRPNTPSIADTLTTYARLLTASRAAAAIAGRNLLIRMNGAV